MEERTNRERNEWGGEKMTTNRERNEWGGEKMTTNRERNEWKRERIGKEMSGGSEKM
jgi:hypothetical protein